MKIVKVRIRRGGVGQSQMVYPSRYRAEEVDRNGLGPLNVNQAGAYSGHIGRGGSEEWCIIVLDDDLANEYALDPNMEIVTPAQADALMEQWRIDNGESEEVVLDPNRINAIVAKQNAGIALTAEDTAALDVNDPIRGINKRLRSMADIIGRIPPRV